MKNHRIMAVDPGTIHTGVVVAELGPNDTLQAVAAKKIHRQSKDHAWDRVSSIVGQVLEMVEMWDVRELWVELYVPYGPRKGSLWNMMLIGALIYLPVTRSLSGLTSYGVYASEWKSWLKKETPRVDSDKIRANIFARHHDIELTDEMEEALTDQHVADALGLLLFSHFRGEDYEHPSCKPEV